ncbi:hypothetical protein SNEBB_001387 [Seison nebaliae]|nr:hypothetical protein SNEBB_001387 [Seison nebaliae]
MGTIEQTNLEAEFDKVDFIVNVCLGIIIIVLGGVVFFLGFLGSYQNRYYDTEQHIKKGKLSKEMGKCSRNFLEGTARNYKNTEKPKVEITLNRFPTEQTLFIPYAIQLRKLNEQHAKIHIKRKNLVHWSEDQII